MFDPRTPTAIAARRLRSTVSWPRALLVVVVLVGLFMLSALVVDGPLIRAVRDWPDYVRAFFFWLTALGKSDWILLPTAIGLLAGAGLQAAPIGWTWRWAARGLMVMSGYVFVSVGLAGLVTVVIKRLVGRARPYVDDATTLTFEPFNLLDYTMHSFPSGHSTTAIAFAVALYTLTNGRFRGLLIAIGLLIGLSRIVVGDHFFSDVVAGLLVGTIVAMLVRDVFASRNWGLSLRTGAVRSRMHVMVRPAWRRLRRQLSAR